jgi:hypothetical protein
MIESGKSAPTMATVIPADGLQTETISGFGGSACRLNLGNGL